MSKKAARTQALLDKEELAKAKRLAKKAKYDPTVPRTVLEIQAARAAAAEAGEHEDDEGIDFDMSGGGFDNAKASGSTLNVNGKRAARQDDRDSDEGDAEDSPNESDFVDDVEDEDLAQPKSANANAEDSSISDIRARLQARIAEKASTRVPPAITTSLTNGAELEGAGGANRDALLEERRKRGALRDKRRAAVQERKRKEKEQGIVGPKKKLKDEQQALAAASGLPLTSQIGKKSSMSDLKKQLKKEGKRQAPANAEDGESSTTAVARPAPQPAATSSKTNAPPAQQQFSASGNSEGNPSGTISFSSLDFTPSSAVSGPDAPKLTKKQRLALGNSTRTGITSNDPTIALNSLNKRKKFLEKLTPQARERAEEKDKWERMALKAQGTKVFDEEAKLKKMVKRKEKAKDKSRKDW